MQMLIKTILVTVMLVTTNAMAELKIAVLNIQQALNETEAAKRYAVDIEKKFAPKIKEIQKIEEEAKKLQEKFNKEADKLAQDKRELMDLEFKQKVRDIQTKSQELNTQKQQSDNEVLQKLKPNLDKAISEVIKQGKYDVVLDKNTVIFVGDDQIDITKQVTEYMNKLK